MNLPSEKDFLAFLADALMSEQPISAMDQRFPEIFLDSTGAMMLAMAIEEKFGVLLPLDQIAKFETPAEIYNAINTVM